MFRGIRGPRGPYKTYLSDPEPEKSKPKRTKYRHASQESHEGRLLLL